MKRPSFQFYPADWRGNAKLRRCSEAARGAWMDIMCILHDSDEYGVCRWPLVDLARAAGVTLKIARELADKGVLKGADLAAAPMVFTPMHAGRLGAPVTLVEPGDGPCWYSSRFVRDEWVRQRRGSASHFTTDNQPPKPEPKTPPMATIGERQGDGPSSSSTSPSAEEDTSLRSVTPTGPRRPSKLMEPEGFAEFYNRFPLHKARPAAAKAYGRARSRASAQALLDGACRYAKSRIGEDPQFTKHPATWLNNDCWLDQEPQPHTGGRNGTQSPSFGASISRAFDERNPQDVFGRGVQTPGRAALEYVADGDHGED